MMRFGICTVEQLKRFGRIEGSGKHVSIRLLDLGDNPDTAAIARFDEICYTLQTSNGTYRTTYRNRFADVNAAATRWIRTLFAAGQPIRVQDRAASNCLTAAEWAAPLLQEFPQLRYTASDLLLFFIEASRGNETFIIEPDGSPLQYIRPPFVIPLHRPEHPSLVVNAWLRHRAWKRVGEIQIPRDWLDSSGEGQRRSGEWLLRKISCIHPEAARLAKSDRRFSIEMQSIFEPTPPCEVLRTMNILNSGYFSADQLQAAIDVVRRSLVEGGLWIVGRTLVEDHSNHATVFRKSGSGFEALERIGNGWELESMATTTRTPSERIHRSFPGPMVP
jgi:hypothetical protein